jgi:hypothetical protein
MTPLSRKESVIMKQRSLHSDRAVRAAWAVVLAALLVVLVMPTVDALAKDRGNPNPGVLAPQCKQVYADLAAEWWIWAFNCPPPPDNPIFDEDGSAADVNQEGPVWFLAGTFGAAVERTCTVPAGKMLYIPLVNHMSFATDPGDTKGKVKKSVTDGLKAATKLHCIIDGEPLEGLFAYRAVAKAFDFPCTEGSLLEWFGYPVGTYSPAVAGAYAVLLDPLSPGKHVIEFGGSKEGDPEDPEDDWAVSVVYNLTVEDDDDADGDDDD